MAGPFVLSWLALSVGAGSPRAAPPPEPSISFVHITDAHIFDEGWKQPVGTAMQWAAEDRRALRWSIDQVNRLAASGTTIDFVVYTGDLGLQNVDVPPECGRRIEPPTRARDLAPVTLGWAVDEVAGELNRLAVRTVYMVAGNNDVVDEAVADGLRYDCFVRDLGKRLAPSALTLTTLNAGGVEVKGVRIVGLNTASFKKLANHEAWCGKPPPPALASLAATGCPKPQMDALRAAATSAPSAFVLFTHVPDLRDPFREIPAWEIDPAVRAIWQGEVCPKLIAIFAGHFHASDRALYGDPTGIRRLALSDCVAGKTRVAPPLAVKNQADRTPQARGLLLATVTASGRVTSSTVCWFPVSCTRPAHRIGGWIWPVLLLAALVALVLGLLWLSRTRYPPAPDPSLPVN